LSKLLIVTADDVGLHRGTTLGAVDAHERGIVTACSVVAGGRDLRHAVELLRGRRRLAVGVHLTLVEGIPVSPPSEIRSLVGRDGMFLPGFRAFLRRWAACRVSLRQVELELRRQIEVLLEAGLDVTHANGHQHLHVLPGVLEVALRLAVEYGIAFVRVPIDRQLRGVPLARSVLVHGLGCLGRRARRRARTHGVATNDATIGIADAGHLSPARLAEFLPLVDGVTELVCHPGVDGRALSDEYRWGYEWDQETAALCDPALREAIRLAGIILARPAEAAGRQNG
jgi:predicted glycoside hydrolase/deacetylase ChbG (UPF0249 family)